VPLCHYYSTDDSVEQRQPPSYHQSTDPWTVAELLEPLDLDSAWPFEDDGNGTTEAWSLSSQ